MVGIRGVSAGLARGAPPAVSGGGGAHPCAPPPSVRFRLGGRGQGPLAVAARRAAGDACGERGAAAGGGGGAGPGRIQLGVRSRLLRVQNRIHPLQGSADGCCVDAFLCRIRRYDPVHWGVPDGSYATDPNGSARVVQFREMVSAINGMVREKSDLRQPAHRAWARRRAGRTM